MSGSDQRWTCQIPAKLKLSDVPWTFCGRQKYPGKVRFWPNLEIVALHPKSDVHRMSPWRLNWCQNRKSMNGEKCSQKEISGHQILTSGGPKPDVPEPPTDVRLLAGTSLYQVMDVRLVLWRPLDVLWTSEISWESQILTKLESKVHERRKVFTKRDMGTSDSDVSRTKTWCPRTSHWRQVVSWVQLRATRGHSVPRVTTP